MMAIKVIYLFMALVPSVIYGKYEYSPFKDVLIRIDGIASANTNDPINGVFKPSPDGYLGEKESHFVYKGLFTPTNEKIAMKFTMKEELFDVKNEYTVYYYLGAVNGTNVMKSSDVEAYGIPMVHYFGVWENYVLLATTLLDAESTKRLKENTINELDMIIMFREFVRITKYIHGKGVLHGNIKLNNIMFRQHQGFMIDFAPATKLFEGARKNLEDFFRMNDANGPVAQQAKLDWKCFLYAALEYIGNQTLWINVDSECRTDHLAGLQLAQNIPDYTNIINQIKNEGLREVLLEFVKHTWRAPLKKGEEPIRDSFYDQVYKVINTHIERMCPDKLGLVSWLDQHQKQNAKNELHHHRIPSIEALVNPYGDQKPIYPTVNFDYFDNLYHVRKSDDDEPIAPLKRSASFKKAMDSLKDSS